MAFSKYIYIENHPATECHREVERCQILVCLPFPCRRKGIQHEPRGPDAQNEFINNSASEARTTPRACEHTPGAPASPGAHPASDPISPLSPPFLKVAPARNFVFAFAFLGRPRAGARFFLEKLDPWLRPQPIRAPLLDFPDLQSCPQPGAPGPSPGRRLSPPPIPVGGRCTGAQRGGSGPRHRVPNAFGSTLGIGDGNARLNCRGRGW